MLIAMNRFRIAAGREQDFEGIWSLGSPTLRKFRGSSNSTCCVARELRGPKAISGKSYSFADGALALLTNLSSSIVSFRMI
jgi:hypothetical protein